MKKIFFLLLFIFSFSLASQLDNLLQKYYYSKIYFTQKTYIKDLDETQEFKGIIYIKKPDFRVDYISPYRQTILVKNNKIYIYNPEENQLIITSARQDLLILNILNILSGKEKINRLFRIGNKKNNRFILLPEQFSDIKKIELLTENGLIKKINIEDKNKNQVEIFINNTIFTKNIELNLKLPENINIINY